MVCATTSGACQGYELRADLDFDTNGDGRIDANDAYWNNGAGWKPIDSLTTTLEGNGHTISHLFINRPSYHRMRDSSVRGARTVSSAISG